MLRLMAIFVAGWWCRDDLSMIEISTGVCESACKFWGELPQIPMPW
jgi:hypothetical protein